MRLFIGTLAILCSIYTVSLAAHPNFRQEWQAADPVAPGSALSLEEKVQAHQGVLDQATLHRDSLKQLFGVLYLFEDYLNAHDFSKAAEYLLNAESLTMNTQHPGWQGFVAFRRGVLNVRLKNYKKAIPYYETAAKLCAIAGDSMCVGESFGQLSSMYGLIGDYTQATQYFELALPLVTRYGTNERLASLLDNYGIMMLNQGRPEASIPYFKNALIANEKAGDLRQATIFQNNLAIAYCQLRQYDQSLKIFQQCIRLGEEKNWREDLIYNYEGISTVYEQTGRYREALDFLKKFHSLQDSLIGASTQKEIAGLEAQYHRQQLELELQKSESALITARLSQERFVLFLSVLVFLAACGLWSWWRQNRQAHRERLQNQANLAKLTRILLEKNRLLLDLEKQSAPQSPTMEDFDEGIYNLRILTSEDWAAFKGFFNKAYPGYLVRLRTTYPALSDAELRLFLFIKLNLSRKEAAAILGISPESVKKTRSRLRYRLGIDKDVDLDAFVLAF